MFDLIIKNVNIVLPKSILFGSVAVKNEKIAAIFSSGCFDSEMPAHQVIDGKGFHLLPGGVDPHVHIRYPAFSHRETFITGTQAAAAGGTTTILEHPVSVPPQFNQEILNNRGKLVEEQALIDVGFLGAAGFEHLDCISDLAKGGIYGYKTFLHDAPKGAESSFEGMTSKNTGELLEIVKEVGKTNLLLAAHTEDNELVTAGIAQMMPECDKPISHCKSRPPLVEVLAVQKLLTLAKYTGARTYLVHISVPEAVEIALQARRDGQEVYIETCPQYLYRDESYLERFGALAKNTPPLRARNVVDGMWKYIEDGSIDVVASDHGPYSIEEKLRNPTNIFDSPNGYAGIEVRIPLMLNAVREKRISLHRAVEMLCSNPAKVFGITNKGEIKIGYDADFILIDLDYQYRLDHTKFYTKGREACSFMDGEDATGKILKTIVRGKVVFNGSTFDVAPGYGKWLKKEV